MVSSKRGHTALVVSPSTLGLSQSKTEALRTGLSNRANGSSFDRLRTSARTEANKSQLGYMNWIADPLLWCAPLA
jgi:hypothetical protein